MGCCASAHQNKTPPSLQTNPHQFPCVSKSPPRAEEEAVKEVLSETPKPRPRPDSPLREHHVHEEDAVKSKLLLLTPKKAFSEQKFQDPCTPTDEISEASEMCSFSESISTATLKEEEDDHHRPHQASSAEVRQMVYRSHSQGFNNGGHYNYNQLQQRRSPARRRPEPSPPRRRNNPSPGGPRRDLVGDNPGRRSQSPGTRANVGRSPSSRRTGPSPGRVRMVQPGPVPGPENEEEGGEVRRESEEWQGPKESLENPLVSLECFIFL